MDGNVNNFEQNEQSFYDDNDDEHLESLSLRDPPIIIPTTSEPSVSRRSSLTADPTSDFFFEFLINNDDNLITSTADDVIFHGRLLPYYAPPPPRRSLSLSSVAVRLTRPQLTESPSESSSLSAFRPSRLLNCRKLHRSNHHRHYSKPKPKPKPKVDMMIHSNCNTDKAPAKLPWYWLVFGFPVKIAAEMELKDMKSRQVRRELTPPAVEREFPGDRSCSGVSWKFLSVLSCKSHASVDVNNTAPLRNSLMF